jgi:acyl carrier protein
MSASEQSRRHAGTVLHRLKTLLSELADMGLSPESIGDEEVIFEEGLELDSSLGVELLLAMENEFGLAIDDADLRMDNFATVASLAALIGEKLSQRNSGDMGDDE